MAIFTTTINNDVFNGGAQNDLFQGPGGGFDRLNGGAGNDRFIVGGNASSGRIDGGIGVDSIVMRGHNNHTFNSNLVITGVENLFLSEPNFFCKASQLNGFTNIVAETDSDEFTIFLDGVGGVLNLSKSYKSTTHLEVDAFGAESAVTLTGSIRGDDLIGSQFADIIVGERGRDVLDGNMGNDIFRFTAAIHSPSATPDLIANFDNFDNDRIDLSLLQGPLLVFRGAGAFTGVGQVRIQDIAGPDVMVQVNLTGTLAPEMQIRLQSVDMIDMTKTDFIL